MGFSARNVNRCEPVGRVDTDSRSPVDFKEAFGEGDSLSRPYSDMLLTQKAFAQATIDMDDLPRRFAKGISDQQVGHFRLIFGADGAFG